MRILRDYGFIVVFFALCLLPLASTTARVTIVQPVDENRKLAAPPAWTSAWAWPPDFTAVTQQADRWYSDHFGLRSLLIRLKTQIDLSVFRTSDRVHIGSGGWLFYRSVMDKEKPAINDQLARSENDVVAGIEAFGTALRAKGIHLIIVPNLLADRFVPEKLPTSVPRLPSPPRFDHFLDRVASLPDISYVDSTAILRHLQQDRPIFHRTDFHWNDPAAFEVARALVETIARLERRPKPVWTHKLEIKVEEMSGWIARFMPVFRMPNEYALFVKPTFAHPSGLVTLSNQAPFEYVLHPPARADLLPTTVVYGDSFFDGITRAGFDVYFQNLYRARIGFGLKPSGIVKSLPADARYVVVQFIEVTGAVLEAFADKADLALATKMIEDRR